MFINYIIRMLTFMGERSNKYILFIFFIVFLKVIFLIASIGDVYLIFFSKEDHAALEEKFNYWKERTEFLFITCMSALLLIMFNPSHKPAWNLNIEERYLLYLFGLILIFTADWSIFINHAFWYPYISQFLPSWLKTRFDNLKQA
jgi:hypothetical protein